jgi:hypothetical protein
MLAVVMIARRDSERNSSKLTMVLVNGHVLAMADGGSVATSQSSKRRSMRFAAMVCGLPAKCLARESCRVLELQKGDAA